jgi:hypothetical protein
VTSTPLDISKTIRNGNYLRTGCIATALAIAMLWLNIVSSWGLEWLGVALQVVLTGWAILALTLWRRATLRVDEEAVRVGGLRRERVVPFAEVASLSIRAPVERTLLVWMFARWKTQARLDLQDGSSLRIRAIQPWPSNWMWDRPEGADRLVDALDDYRDLRSGIDSVP